MDVPGSCLLYTSIMAVVAYLRVSTEKQFLENQREEIIRFAETVSYTHLDVYKRQIPTIDTELLILSENKKLFQEKDISLIVSDQNFIRLCSCLLYTSSGF